MPLSVRDILFFKGLSEAELKAVQECLRERAFGKGDTLFTEGDSCERIFFVRAGRVKLVRNSTAGREQTLETLGPGDTCACNPGSSKWHCASSAIALESGAAWFLSRDNYVRLLQTNGKLARSLNRLFAERLQCFSRLIEEVALKDSKKRLVRFLLEVPDLSLSREELAQRLGMARETLARQLHELKRKKLIGIKARHVLLLNKAALEKLL